MNLDWLEVYALEPNDQYPMNAEWFREHGYDVKEREYGTRVYKEMFVLRDEQLNPIMEIRREPASGASDFTGLVPQSVHLRLPNWILYQGNPVRWMMDFMLKNGYIFKRIFRIDIAYDFEYFDSGDLPARFVRRYIEGKFRKINQCELTAHGKDNWSSCDWNSLSWGSRSSMVSTKMYNKSLELKEGKTDKPYIRTAWMLCGLVDNPVSMTKRDKNGKMVPVDIWRVEFSMRSSCDGWIVIETENGKRSKQQHIPHRLPLFDSKDKLWQRFQDLAYHYFRFKYMEYKSESKAVSKYALGMVNSDIERQPQRKDRCRDKVLFKFDPGHQFTQATLAPSDSKHNRKDDTLERLLQEYSYSHANPEVRKACEVLLKEIDLNRLVNYSPKQSRRDAQALQLTLARKMGGDPREIATILDEVLQLLNQNEIF